MAAAQVITAVLAKEPCTGWSGLCWIESHPGLASWVQAVGAISALILAVGLPYLQTWQRERGFRRTALGAASEALITLASAENYSAHENKNEQEMMMPVIAGAVTAVDTSLTAFPAYEMGRPNHIVAWTDFVVHARTLAPS